MIEPTLKAVFFDLDDTLIDWSGFNGNWDEADRKHILSVYEYMNNEVHPLRDFDDLLREFRRRIIAGWESARSTMRAPHMENILSETLTAMGVPAEKIDARQILKHYNWGALDGVSVFPEVPEMLEFLIDQGIKVGIVTNSLQPICLRDIELEQYGLKQYFPECRVTAADVGYLKPHINIFREAMNKLRVEPGEAVFIGDNPVADVGGAQAAGMRGILRIRDGAHSSTISLVTPDCALQSLRELPPILDKWFPGWGI